MDFNGKAIPRSAAGLALAIETIGCEPAAFRAVIAVETGGRGFDALLRPKALFEPHIFWRVVGEGPRKQAAIAAGLAYEKWGTRPYPRDSYPRIMAACAIDVSCACLATSWGLPQILGANFKAAGYPNAQAMVGAFCDGEDEQLVAMARFIVSEDLAGPLKRNDWARFAKGYNGPGFARNRYDEKLAKAYAHFKVERPMAAVVAPLPAPRIATNMLDTSRPVLRKGARGAAVLELQRELLEEGCKLTADGTFGPATDAAVRECQRRFGLVADGVVGARTWGCLRVSEGPVKEAA